MLSDRSSDRQLSDHQLSSHQLPDYRVPDYQLPSDQALPHRRYDPLRGRWVLVSAGRDRRPWRGDTDVPSQPDVPPYDSTCPLCPGNDRPGGQRNPEYTGPYVFTNDFPALRPEPRRPEPRRDRVPDWVPDGVPHGGSGGGAGRVDPSTASHPLLRAEPETGTCRVLCFGPRHDVHLATMSDSELREVVDTWAAQTAELNRAWRWVQVFENRGAAMGASNPHPHGQIWASASLPDEPAAEDARQRDYLRRHGRRLLADYAEAELRVGDRVVTANAGWLVVVPFWAVWPFETLLVPRRPVASLPALDEILRAELVEVLRALLVGYDALFGVPFPYSMGWHGAPGATLERAEHWQLHAHFFPPLLRSPTVRKFLVGYEMFAGVQRDITPEHAAARLREHVPGADFATGRMTW